MKRPRRSDVFSGDLEWKLARRWGVEEDVVLDTALVLWGRTFSDERDARARDRIAGLPKRAAQTVRGHITRQLIAEVER